jgi:cytochrome c2
MLCVLKMKNYEMDRAMYKVVAAIAVIFGLNGCVPDTSTESLNQETEPTDVQTAYIFSSLHDLKVSNYEIQTGFKGERHYPMGGALAIIGKSQLLLVDGKGDFYSLNHENGAINSTRLERLKAPINSKSYQNNAKTPSRNFRVTDMLVEQTENENIRTIFVANHRWDEEEGCINLSVYEGKINIDTLDTSIDWQKRFSTTPCLDGERLKNETGGRLAFLGPSSLILTVGVTFVSDEYWGIAADDLASYGKIIEIDRKTWESKILSKGHRNPQGLLVDEGRIWSTEHGPKGGDELNLVLPGEDYGWPSSSYGVDTGGLGFGVRALKGNDTPGEHSYGVRPVFSWVPSVGISNLLKVEGVGFPLWKNDFLIGSLIGKGMNGRSIYRVRLHKDVVKVVEQIPTGFRVRDLVELPNGDIIVWDGRWTVQVITPASQAFSMCTSCHSIEEGWPSSVAPNLFGVINRRTASVSDYEYSSAMKEVSGSWTRERLDEFLRNPQALVPGTSMDMAGIEDSQDRQEIIERLEDLLH